MSAPESRYLGTHIPLRLLGHECVHPTADVLINFPLWSPAELTGFAPVVERLRDAGVWTPPAERGYSW